MLAAQAKMLFITSLKIQISENAIFVFYLYQSEHKWCWGNQNVGSVSKNVSGESKNVSGVSKNVVY